MDMKLTPDDEAFRSEVIEFLRQNLTPEILKEASELTGVAVGRELGQKWSKILNQRGWAASAWPAEYGGTGWSAMEHYIFSAEHSLAGAPVVNATGTQLAGPTIIAFGTDDQKSQYLERTKSGEYVWAQGYSEPGAGSDLAQLKCHAERVGDNYIINGSKIWTTYAHWSDKIFCLVRTDASGKPQQGITFLIFDIGLPGITIRPIITLAGEHEVNEVFFDNVHVPLSSLVGEEGQGWMVAKHLLTNERLVSYAPFLRNRFVNLKSIALREVGHLGDTLLDDPLFAAKLADAGILLDALELAELRFLARIKLGNVIGAESSQLKVKASELRQFLTELAMEAIAYYAIPMQPTATNLPHADTLVGSAHSLTVMALYLNDRATTIYGGANEVQRNIMAKNVLGL